MADESFSLVSSRDDGLAQARARAETAPSSSASTPRSLSAVRLWLRDTRMRLRLRRYRRRLDREPDNLPLLKEYAAYLEVKSFRAEAAECYVRLARLYRIRRDADEVAFYCRKLDFCASPDATRVHRELAILYSDLSRPLEAARACRRVVEGYLREGHVAAATGFIRQLPRLGPHEKSTRAELEALVAGSLGDQLARRSAAAQAVTDASTREEVFLSGSLGRVTPFDVIQIIESNVLTGRLDVDAANGPASLYFRDGRIVAARFGATTGVDAARAVLSVSDARFRVVNTVAVPDDQFNARNNTGFLLEILKEIDEAKRASDGDATSYSTSPLRDPFDI